MSHTRDPTRERRFSAMGSHHTAMVQGFLLWRRASGLHVIVAKCVWRGEGGFSKKTKSLLGCPKVVKTLVMPIGH